MPRGRSRRGAVMLLCSAVAVVFAYLGWGAAHTAESAQVAYEGAASWHVLPRQPRPIPLSAAEKTRKPQSARRLAAARRAAVYRIAFFGDSVTVGFGASARSRAYVADVSRWLETQGKRVVRTVDAKGGVPVAYWEWAWMPKRLDAAVVELGTNDVRLGTPGWQFASEYRRLTARIRAADPKARLLCLSVWSHPVAAGPDSVINARIRATCPGTYVDITSFRRLSHIRSEDGFHPNDTGYRLIAQAIESKLKAG